MLAALAVCLTASASANELTLTPDDFEIDAAAGDTVQKNFTVEWTGSQAADVELDYTITAENTDTEGINVSLSDDSFTLSSNSSVHEYITIQTDYALKPDTFGITVNASTSLENKTQKQNKTENNGGKGAGAGNTTDNNTEVPPPDINITEPENQTNDTINLTDPPSGWDNSTSDNDDESENGVFGSLEEAASNPLEHPITILTVFVLLTVLFAAIIVGYEKYMEQKQQKQSQEPEEEVVTIDGDSRQRRD